jgi:hypothetical protein
MDSAQTAQILSIVRASKYTHLNMIRFHSHTVVTSFSRHKIHIFTPPIRIANHFLTLFDRDTTARNSSQDGSYSRMGIVLVEDATSAFRDLLAEVAPFNRADSNRSHCFMISRRKLTSPSSNSRCPGGSVAAVRDPGFRFDRE